jgi:hypothetical protein
MMRIYRQGDDDPELLIALPIAFGAKHTWLLHVCGLRLQDDDDSEPVVVRTVHGVIDGDMRVDDNVDAGVVDVMDGAGGDRLIVHAACYEIAGGERACDSTLVERISNSDAWQDAEQRYHEQLFDFDALLEDDRAWWLADPTNVDDDDDGRRNRERIQAMITAATAP